MVLICVYRTQHYKLTDLILSKAAEELERSSRRKISLLPMVLMIRLINCAISAWKAKVSTSSVMVARVETRFLLVD